MKVLSLIVIGFWLLAQPAQAAIIISEVHPNPLTGPEWVELFNDGATVQDLAGWILEDQLASPSIIQTMGAVSLPPLGYVKLDLTTQKLNNTADGVTLKDTTGTVIASMAYASTTAGLSWHRLANSSYALGEPTPGQPPSSASPTPSPAVSPTPSPSTNPAAYLYLQASEIQACPETGEQEWLELYNPTDYPIEIVDWHVKDTAENLRPVASSIPPHDFGSVSWSSGLLNNTGDSLQLITPESEVIFTAAIGPCQKYSSHILFETHWQLTTTITRNAPNQLTQPSPTPSALAAMIKTSPTSKPLPNQPGSSPSSPTTESSLSSKDVSNTQKLINQPNSPSATTSLKLSATITHPFASPSAVIDLSQTTPSFGAFLNVIMGGTVLVATHGLKLYRLYQHAHTLDTDLPVPPRILFP